MKKHRLLWVVLAVAFLAGCPEDRKPATEASPIPPSAEGGFDAGPMPAGGSAPSPEVKPDAGEAGAGKAGPG